MNNLKCPECGHGTFEEIEYKRGYDIMRIEMRCTACHSKLVTSFAAVRSTFGDPIVGPLELKQRRKA